MLLEILDFFGGVSPGGALALLAIGYLIGAATRGYVVYAVTAVYDWYAGRHD